LGKREGGRGALIPTDHQNRLEPLIHQGTGEGEVRRLFPAHIHCAKKRKKRRGTVRININVEEDFVIPPHAMSSLTILMLHFPWQKNPRKKRSGGPQEEGGKFRPCLKFSRRKKKRK